MNVWNSIVSLFRSNRGRGNSGRYRFAKVERKLGRHLVEQNPPKQETPPPSPNRESGIFEDFTIGNAVLSDTRIHPTKSYVQNRYMKNTYGSDTELSVAISDEDLLSSVECPRCRSCVLDSRFDIFSAVKSLDERADSSDNGYDSMDNSNTSIASLFRSSSIQDKSLRLMRKRHQNVVKRKHVRANSDDSCKIDLQLPDSLRDSNIPIVTTRPIPVTSSTEVCRMSNIPIIQEEKQVHFIENENVGEPTDEKKTETKLTKNTALSRGSSIQMKSWQIRRQRKDLSTKQRKAARLSMISLNTDHEDRLI